MKKIDEGKNPYNNDTYWIIYYDHLGNKFVLEGYEDLNIAEMELNRWKKDYPSAEIVNYDPMYESKMKETKSYPDDEYAVIVTIDKNLAKDFEKEIKLKWDEFGREDYFEYYEYSFTYNQFIKIKKIVNFYDGDVMMLESVKNKKPIKEVSVADKHQLKIAKSTLKMNDAGAMIMGGMSKDEARAFLKKMGYTDNQIAKMEESSIKEGSYMDLDMEFGDYADEISNYDYEGYDEPEIEDAFINVDGREYMVSVEGRSLGTFNNIQKAEKALEIWMQRNRSYPTVWLVDNRGNAEVYMMENVSKVHTLKKPIKIGDKIIEKGTKFRILKESGNFKVVVGYTIPSSGYESEFSYARTLDDAIKVAIRYFNQEEIQSYLHDGKYPYVPKIDIYIDDENSMGVKYFYWVVKDSRYGNQLNSKIVNGFIVDPISGNVEDNRR